MQNDSIRMIHERHSVRQYKQMPIAQDVKQMLLSYLKELSEESGLKFCYTEKADKVFGSVIMKAVGWNQMPPAYFSVIGEKNPQNEEKCGYYGEKLVLFAQSLGLNTCWVGLFQKGEVDKNTLITIAVGYGQSSGKERKSKTAAQVSQYAGETPTWFQNGIECALLAPTAVNRQGFFFKGEGKSVSISESNGILNNIDRGIVKYHFEIGAGKENFDWVDEIH